MAAPESKASIGATLCFKTKVFSGNFMGLLLDIAVQGLLCYIELCSKNMHNFLIEMFTELSHFIFPPPIKHFFKIFSIRFFEQGCLNSMVRFELNQCTLGQFFTKLVLKHSILKQSLPKSQHKLILQGVSH